MICSKLTDQLSIKPIKHKSIINNFSSIDLRTWLTSTDVIVSAFNPTEDTFYTEGLTGSVVLPPVQPDSFNQETQTTESFGDPRLCAGLRPLDSGYCGRRESLRGTGAAERARSRERDFRRVLPCPLIRVTPLTATQHGNTEHGHVCACSIERERNSYTRLTTTTKENYNLQRQQTKIWRHHNSK